MVTWLRGTNPTSKLLYKINYKSLNDDIFDDIIDYEEPTMLQVYIKSSDVYYIGKFCYREEKGVDSWIVLINYCVVDKLADDIVFNPKASSYKSVMTINLRDVERIQTIYEDNSKVWKKLSGAY